MDIRPFPSYRNFPDDWFHSFTRIQLFEKPKLTMKDYVPTVLKDNSPLKIYHIN